MKSKSINSGLAWGFVATLLLLTACGGGGSGSGDQAGNDVITQYVSEFSYASPSIVYRPWDSLELMPTVKYLKPNPDLVFSVDWPDSTVSVNPSSGKVTFSDRFSGSCAIVFLKWAKTGESLFTQVCMDKQRLGISQGLSKAGNNSVISSNGRWVYTISKSDPATISLAVGLDYFDRMKNETRVSGGVFPDSSNTTCALTDGNLPVLVKFNRQSESSTLINYGLDIDWSKIPVGEYESLIQCTLSSGEKSVSESVRGIIKVVQ